MAAKQSSKKTTKFVAWRQSRPGWAVLGLVELVLAYIVASRALDTGSWWEYLFAFLLLVGALQNLVRLIRGR